MAFLFKLVLRCRHLSSYTRPLVSEKKNIYVRSGKGGNGCVSFTKDPMALGPDGGDGGDGGNVLIRIREHFNNLHVLKSKYIGEDGGVGMNGNRHGHNGNDLIIEVPNDTIIRNCDMDKEILLKWSEDKSNNSQNEWLLLEGGRGGKGNKSFATSTLQSPKICELGEEGSEMMIDIRLNYFAHLAICGLSNSGKSTLMKLLSRARVPVEEWPFSTVTSILGTVDFESCYNYSSKYQTFLLDTPAIDSNAYVRSRIYNDLNKCLSFSLIINDIDDIHQILSIIGNDTSELFLKKLIGIFYSNRTNKRMNYKKIESYLKEKLGLMKDNIFFLENNDTTKRFIRRNPNLYKFLRHFPSIYTIRTSNK
ncbi:hypothetical protein SNEBB_006354 [Seison nebaliae]|nr:hypothetical protein SNEBB_006354 [Seison nebaliae]